MNTIANHGEGENGIVLEMDDKGLIYVTDNASTQERVSSDNYTGPGWDTTNDQEWVDELEGTFGNRNAAILFVGFARNGMPALNETDNEIWDDHTRKYNLF